MDRALYLSSLLTDAVLRAQWEARILTVRPITLLALPPEPLGIVMHECLLAARLAHNAGHPAHAQRLLRDAAQVLSRGQGSVHSLEVRAALAFHADRIRAFDLALANLSGRTSRVFDSVERWRATSYRAPPLQVSADAETDRLVGELRRLRRLQLTKTGPGEISQLQATISRRLRSHAASQTPISSAHPVDVRVAQKLARAHRATIVSFHADRGVLIRLVVSPESLQHNIIGDIATITTMVDAVTSDGRATALAPPSMLRTLTHARAASRQSVDAMLLADLSFDPMTLVVIIPTAILASLPWRALPSLSDLAVVVAPSVTAWARRSTCARAPLSVASLAGPGLPRAEAEARGVAHVWGRHTVPGRVPPDRYAGTRDVIDALANASVVHIAAHGHHEQQTPLFSCLELADGPLFAHEIGARPRAEHVILSACEVGQSRGRLGDEPLGLTSALLSLGVGSVVAATTPVRDHEACAAMIDYHRRLRTGLDAASALRDTVRVMPGADSFCVYGATWSPPPGGLLDASAG